MKSLTKQIEQLVLNEENVERRHLLGKLATSINMNVAAEDRDKDPLWFDGKLGKHGAMGEGYPCLENNGML